jgi:predicted RNA-binding protein (virulence factor B family)
VIELGKQQELTIVKKVDFGVYVGEEINAPVDERVLLPGRQVPEGAQVGDKLLVFIYKDSSDRLIATTRQPVLQLHETAVLPVAQVGRIGVFLNWGLEKDLLLPYREQTHKVQDGEDCLVALYVDKSDRLCATMKVYPYLKTDSPYQKGDTVKGRVYEISQRFGVFVAVDNQYSGLVPAIEVHGDYSIGEVLDFRITEVRPDGKLNLSSKQKAYIQIKEDGQMIMDRIHQYGGELPFDDKASPDVIRQEFQMSKAAFKRAVGHLMKEEKVEILDQKIRAK